MATRIERLVLLGLDGATWTVLRPMIDRGIMPNLAALLRGSSHGILKSCIPPVTSAAWTTMQTGCGPARHGVFDHRYYDAKAGRMKVNHSGRIRVPTLWSLLSDAGRSVAVINLPGTYPPPDVRGVVVSGMDAPDLDAALGGSPTFADRLRREVPDYNLRFFWKRPPESLEELREAVGHTTQAFEHRALAGLAADREVPDWSALMVQFQDLDPFQHRCWPLLNVDGTGLDRPEWNEEAWEVLRGLDRAIGIVCELAEKRGASVIAVSDHGFGPCAGRIHVNRILIDAGLARMPGRATRRWVLRMFVPFDRLRLWWEKSHRPDARSSSFEKSVAHEFPFDWKRTVAFAPHQDTAAMVYLHSEMRHPGCTAPIKTPRQLDDACRSARQALAEARHPETGRPLFPRVIGTAQDYGIDPAREDYPDLIALPDDPYWVRTRLSSGKAWVEPDPSLPGTHRPEGIIMVRAPGFAPGAKLSADLQDVTPTALDLLGEAIPAHIEGRSLISGMDRPRQAIRIHQAAAPIAGPHRPDFDYSLQEQAVIEQRLADLGYLE
ncbi:MAG: alkaline phosphatase family protein [Isosphaeraceae bacterium]